jgi:hypothetical protein
MRHSISRKCALRTFVGLLTIAQALSPTDAAVDGAAITIGISEEAQKQFAAEIEKSDDPAGFGTIEYFTRRSSSLLEVIPRVPETRQGERYDYLEGLATEKPLSVSAGGCGYHVSFPALDVRIVNNSSKPLLLTRATLALNESSVDTTPLLFVNSAPSMFEFGVYNEGWGAIEECRIQFNLDYIRQDRVPEVFTFDRKFGRFEDDLTVRVDEELQRVGIPRQYITGMRDFSNLTTAKLEKLQAALPARLREAKGAERGVWLSGVITYSWRDGKGQMRQRRNPLFCEILLELPEYGAPGPIAGKYEAMLRSKGRDYEVTVPISQSVPKGGVTRFALRVGAPQSSFHDMKLKLQSTTGEIIESEQFKLTVLLPRSCAVQARVEDRKQ